MNRILSPIVYNIVQEAEQNEQQNILDELNFNNEQSKRKRKNAEEKITQSDDLLKSAREHRENNDVEKAEADEKGSVQSSLEAMELYGKSILDADEQKVIRDPRHRVNREALESRHNIGALHRSLENKGINLYEKKEINQIYSRLGKEEDPRFPRHENGQPSYLQPYNAVRYGSPEVTNDDAAALNHMAKTVKGRYEEMVDKTRTFEAAGRKYRQIVDEEGRQSLELIE